MENAGLLTYGEDYLLQAPGTHSPATFGRTFLTLPVHEMAHQWFGNLVTMAWWDDTWLNEAMATWMEYKIMNEWNPDGDGALSGAMALRVASKAHDRGSARP